MANVTHGDPQPFRLPPYAAFRDEPPTTDQVVALRAAYAPARNDTDTVVVHAGAVFHTKTP